MKLIVGLGNPGRRYKKTRHNIGFRVLDEVAKSIGVQMRPNEKMFGETAKTGNCILLKPTTFMNLSGNSVKKVVEFYKIKTHDIMVVYDDVDLPVGKIKIRQSGGSGGHNGIKSIMSQIGENFNRVRFGIDKDIEVVTSHYVLSKFPKKDRPVIDESLNTVKNAVLEFIGNGDILKIMNKYN